jgi:hypothetical protein
LDRLPDQAVSLEQVVFIAALAAYNEMMKRYWPFAFLIALGFLLFFRATPSPGEFFVPMTRSSVPAELPSEVIDPPVPLAPASNPAPKEEAAPEEDKPQTRSAVLSALLWAAQNQNEDGSWGDVPVTIGGRTIGRTGVTALALLSLLGAGYSHLSKDEYDGVCMGSTVKRAVKWMISQQREDGTFLSTHDLEFDQALGALALSEAYGMTASPPLKDPAQNALDALVRLQETNGSWGAPEPTAWAIHAIVSAELSELICPSEVRDLALKYVDSGTAPHPGNLSAKIWLTKKKAPLEAEAAALAAAIPDGGTRDFSDWFHATSGVFQFDGPDGPLWKKFNEPAKEGILPLQGRNGSWQGGTLSHTLVRSSLATLTMEVYYRYVNVFMAAH